jgi:2-dehydro-3-deoxygluconokinase
MENNASDKATFLSVGECMLELTPQKNGGAWDVGFAGDTFNTMWYVRALTNQDLWNVSYLTRVGVDDYSDKFIDYMQKNHIDTQWIGRDKRRHLGLYMTQIFGLIYGEIKMNYGIISMRRHRFQILFSPVLMMKGHFLGIATPVQR